MFYIDNKRFVTYRGAEIYCGENGLLCEDIEEWGEE